MGGVVSGIGGAVSGVLGGIGANKAAKQQVAAQDRAMAASQSGYNSAVSWMSPYEEAGQSGLKGLQGIAGQPIDREALLSEYFNSPEFQMMADQARNQGLRGAQATGGLGSTATGNMLSSIAPTLGQNYLADMTDQQQAMYSQLMGLTNMGAQSANALGNFAVGQGNTMAGLQQQMGQIKGGKAALPWQVASSANSSINNGASSDINQFTGMFGGMMGGGLF
ncbi:DNA transfer protein [Pectobacterium parmentieri]|uniref:DNA transfer protein n=1 Tax=Pectobacterium parmentieri TaxID=1905730 RepID=UPI000D613F9A|nr:DNA transfer protein [Pectobacterium parmentieri]MBI0520867.1 DNA transfer protein [Pectobacterium parmentieri]PWD58527.1 DNA transfer protein [Pectobacterium parmentieri]QQA77065.1 DNA transfer protein [Pectobacterium parmentieri]